MRACVPHRREQQAAIHTLKITISYAPTPAHTQPLTQTSVVSDSGSEHSGERLQEESPRQDSEGLASVIEQQEDPVQDNHVKEVEGAL